MACAATPMIGYTVTREVREVRKQLDRARWAKKISGPNLNPDFVKKTKLQLRELNENSLKFIAQLNSGLLDNASEAILVELKARLVDLVLTADELLKSARVLKLQLVPGFRPLIEHLEGSRNRFVSIHEGISLSLQVEFRLGIEDAVGRLQAELQTHEPVHC